MMWRKADVIEWLRMAASMARAELDACAQPRNIARLRELLTDTDRMLRELQSVPEIALRQPVMDHDDTPWGVTIMAAAEFNMSTMRGGMKARLLQYPDNPALRVTKAAQPLSRDPDAAVGGQSFRNLC